MTIAVSLQVRAPSCIAKQGGLASRSCALHRQPSFALTSFGGQPRCCAAKVGGGLETRIQRSPRCVVVGTTSFAAADTARRINAKRSPSLAQRRPSAHFRPKCESSGICGDYSTFWITFWVSIGPFRPLATADLLGARVRISRPSPPTHDQRRPADHECGTRHRLI
jgi:hypothetical protein